MAYRFPFECEPFYMRPLLMTKSIFGAFFTILIYFVIPIAVALVIILAIAFVLFAILAVLFGWGPSLDEIKAKREKEKSEREQKERDQEANQGDQKDNQGDQKGNQGDEKEKQAIPDAYRFTAPLPATASGFGGTYDLTRRLEIELELLGEMVVARKERLAALKMTHSGDDSSYLEVLEKLE
ncbi:hypothetical protein N7471_009254 [Penicillium samsonianum]|uniref:uncharacterized protein n=1 Tax=Penicillium samsonianum TaxID=1882272 RepID=UPI002548D927|nr:uncharacterized protein N7471_009254 [Penicillium samsonianum]KAJ6128037.1 hypothetical protein N7471_009254 [Penicillium samsonianum]